MTLGCKFRLALIYIGILIGVMYFNFLKSTHPFLFLLGCCLILVFGVITWRLATSGESLWWFLFLGTISLLTVVPFQVLMLDTILSVKLKSVGLTVLLSVPIFACGAFIWGVRVCDGEILVKAMDAKRINVEKGTFTFFPFLATLFAVKGKKIERWLWMALFIGAPFIFISSIVLGSHWTGKYKSEALSLGFIMNFWFTTTVFAACAGVILKEYILIGHWKKQKGRKMYLDCIHRKSP